LRRLLLDHHWVQKLDLQTLPLRMTRTFFLKSETSQIFKIQMQLPRQAACFFERNSLNLQATKVNIT
jgi:hypothetical protein